MTWIFVSESIHTAVSVGDLGTISGILEVLCFKNNNIHCRKRCMDRSIPNFDSDNGIEEAD